MAVAVVVFDGTRVNPSDANTNWGNWGSSGGSPAAESPIAYQNALAVNKKINSSSLGGIDYDPGAGALDMTAAVNMLWFVKTIVSDSFDLNTTYGVSIGMGSSNADFYQYNVAGSGSNNPAYTNYPVQGGYLITAIDPNIAAWRESTTGAPDLTAVDWFGVQADFIVGAAKAENLALDSIDVGTGLTITAGDGGSTEGSFLDFVAFDQDTSTNRYGVVTGKGDIVASHGLLTIGSAAVTEFLDNTSIVLFPDGYHSRGLVGVSVDLSNASTIVHIGSLLIGEGTEQALSEDDTRPDLVVTGTAGTLTLSGTLRNFRTVSFTSACTIDGADIEVLVLGASGNIKNSTIRTRTAANSAALSSPVFTVDTGVHDTEFVQAGAGHALGIVSAGSYTLTNLTFTGYGVDDAADSAITVFTTGAVTLTIVGGTIPTFKTVGVGNVTIVTNPVTTKVIMKDPSGDLITDLSVNVLVEADTGGPLAVGTDIIKGFTDVVGEIENTQSFTSNQPVKGWARKSTISPYYRQSIITGTIDKDNGLTLTIQMVSDE